MIRIDHDKCENCGQCVLNCPTEAIGFDAEDRPTVVDADECLGYESCGECQDLCPCDAITL